MRIGEVAELTKLNVSSIRFYERKGLLAPVREQESKYRNYTAEDVCRIKQILLCRKMGIPVETIYLLFHGQADFHEVLLRQKAELKDQMAELEGAIELCGLVLMDPGLDAQKVDDYLNYVHEEERQGKQFAQAREWMGDVAEYTRAGLFHNEPWILWLFRKPWIANVCSAGIWIAILSVPLMHSYECIVNGKDWNISLMLLYGVIILVYGAGFLAFRRARKKGAPESSKKL